MDGYLRQSTASQARLIGPFVDDTDFKTAETGLTIANTDIKLRANGTTLANKNSGGGTHQANGMYSVTWDATDTANVGELKYSVVVSGALQVFGSYVVLEEAVYDALMAASALGYVDGATVNATKIGGTSQTGRDIGASVLLSAGTGTGQLDFTSGVVKANATQWLGGTIPAVNVTGVPLVDTKYLLGTIFSTPATAGILDVNVKNMNNVAATAITTIKAVQGLAVDGVITTLTNLPAITANWLTAAGTAADFSTEVRTAINGGDYALSTDSNGRIRIVDGTGTGEIDTASGLVSLAASQTFSMTGNITGNLSGSVASVTAAVSLSAGDSPVMQSGTAAAGGASTITIQTALGADSLPVGSIIKITSGTGAKQARIITAYVDATKVATVDRAWVTNPDNTSVYSILFQEQPKLNSSLQILGVVLADTATNLTNLPTIPANWLTAAGTATDFDTEIAAAVWDLATSGHTTSGTFGAAMNAAGSAGDPWATSLPGAYSAGTAGHIVGTALPDIAPGSANGLLRGGTNTATTFATLTSTGAFSINGTPNVAQTGDGYAVVNSGTFGNSALKTLIDAIKTDTAAILLDTGTDGVVLNAAGLQTDAVQEVRNAITGGAYALDTDANGAIRVVDGTGARELDTASGLVKISGTLQTLDSLNTSILADNDVTQAAIAALNNLSQANIRTAVGLTSANLDTQLDALPTNAELATALGTADDATLAAIAALNNLSATQVWDLADGIETGYTPRKAMRAIAAKAMGLISGAGTGTEVVKGLGQTSGGTTRGTATVDGSGNISAWTLNL